MILLAVEGLSNEEIAYRLHTRREVVSLWRKRFFDQRLTAVEEHPRPGRLGGLPPRPGGAGQGGRLRVALPLGGDAVARSVAEIANHARQCGLIASISDSTVWRWLNEDPIRPWQHRCWMVPS